MEIAHSGTTILASFLASAVECVEALTVVLAVAIARGPRPALVGAGTGLVVLAGLVAVLGPALTRVPVNDLQIAIGILLLLFGMRWLRKAILRAAGIVPLHDEAVAFSSELQALGDPGSASSGGWDLIGLGTSFKAVMLEGIEVVFILIAFAAGGNSLASATMGAGTAFLLVSLTGLLLYRPLTLVPENALKMAVGIMLSAFGTYWLGEGYGLNWPGSDLALLGLIAGFAIAAFVGVRLSRGVERRHSTALPVLGGR
jgi:uncharacterized membrane protein